MITSGAHIIILFLVTSLFNNTRSVCPTNCVCRLKNHISLSIACSKQELDKFPESISDMVEYLDLSINNLRLLPPNEIGRFSGLKQFNLSTNKLSKLPDEFENLHKLEKLDLSNNLISDINESLDIISRISNLRVLSLKNNPITNLELLKNSAIQTLDVSQCLITQMTNDTLLGLPELISLKLNGNPLKTIDYIKSPTLKLLDLSNCYLNYLYPDTFRDAPELEQLRMANNPILVYSTRKETLKHDKLKRLDVSGCNLDRPGIHGLPALTHVILSQNTIRHLPDRIFARNKMLVHLNLNGNGLTQINKSSFVGLPKLEVLDLSNNNLEIVPWMMLRDNINLHRLNLSFNDIQEFPINFTTTAAIIDFSNNLIEYIPKESLQYMPRIENLNLSKNRLETFSSGVESQTLKVLILEGNRLVRLSNQSFSYLPSLTGIDLSGNRLTEGLDYEVFECNQDLHAVRLHDNPWRCDCEQLYPMYYYLTRSSKTNPSTLICSSPSNVSGYTWITACQTVWGNGSKEILKSERTYGLVLMGLLIVILIFGSIVSVGHTIKEKRRRALLRIREQERAEARERLLLHRRNQLEEYRHQQENIPRVHPEELIGPPTYEEAVQMPRLVRSLDNLNSLSAEELPVHSAQSLAENSSALTHKRRRQQRKRVVKRTKSENNLEGGHDNRMRSNDRSTKKFKSRSNLGSQRLSEANIPGKVNSGQQRVSESEEPSSSVDGSSNRTLRSRPLNIKQKRRFLISRNNGHSSDDEDSDVHRNQSSAINNNNKSDKIHVIELPREPRSGTYKPSSTSGSSSLAAISLISAPGSSQEDTNEQISRSRIV